MRVSADVADVRRILYLSPKSRFWQRWEVRQMPGLSSWLASALASGLRPQVSVAACGEVRARHGRRITALDYFPNVEYVFQEELGLLLGSYSRIMFGDKLAKEAPLRQLSNLSSPLRQRLRAGFARLRNEGWPVLQTGVAASPRGI